MSFSENLYYLRKREGISQEELAEKLGVSRQAVSKWETGDAYPETEKIMMLCDRYGVTMDALMRGDVKEQSPEKQVPEQEPEEASAAIPEPVQTEKDDNEDAEQMTAAQKIAQVVLWVGAAAVYLLLGMAWNLWHPLWIIFVIMPAVASVVDLILAPKEKRAKEIGGTIDFVVIIGAVVTYLLCGFYADLWHIMWVVFLIIPITCVITDLIFSKNKKD